jgi:hypothetical protein
MARKQVNFRLPQDKFKALQEKANRKGKKLNTILEELVDNCLADDSDELVGKEISLKKAEAMINEAIAPLVERIEKLENANANLANYINQLESANQNNDSNKLANTSNNKQRINSQYNQLANHSNNGEASRSTTLADASNELEHTDGNQDSNQLANTSNQEESKEENHSRTYPDTNSYSQDYSQPDSTDAIAPTSTTENKWESPREAERRLHIGKKTIERTISNQFKQDQERGKIDLPKLKLAFLVTRKVEKDNNGKTRLVKFSTRVQQINFPSTNGNNDSNQLANHSNEPGRKVESTSPNTATSYKETVRAAEERLNLRKGAINGVICRKLNPTQKEAKIYLPKLELAFYVEREIENSNGKTRTVFGSTRIQQLNFYG